MPYDDLVTSVEDHEERIAQNESDISDAGSNFDEYTQQNDQDIQDLKDTQGQLTFPLSQDTVDLLNGQEMTMLQYIQQQGYIGTAVLVAGTVTLSNPFVTTGSLILLTTITKGGTQGILSYVPSAGSLIINSTSATDTSTVLYFILIP